MNQTLPQNVIDLGNQALADNAAADAGDVDAQQKQQAATDAAAVKIQLHGKARDSKAAFLAAAAALFDASPDPSTPPAPSNSGQ